MNGVWGIFYDGVSSAQRRVLLAVEGGRLVLRGDGMTRSAPLADLKVDPRLGTVRRAIRFADGALCEVSDDRFLDGLLSRQGRGRAATFLHRWERSIPRALAALAVMVAVIWLFFAYGIPFLAKKVAYAIPPATEVTLGRESLAMLDKLVFAPTRLPVARRREISALFRRMVAERPETSSYRLEFRRSPEMGANALALPSGIIVVTDALVPLAKNDDELAAVLAHEIGHVRYRHALRQVLQNSAAGLIMAAVTGDIFSATSLSAGLPTALVDAKFSRDFETEADDAAVVYLKAHHIPLQRFADILGRLEADHAKREAAAGKTEERSFSDYFASHPVTAERIRRILAGGRS